jgi:hypothetical protein
VVFLVLGSAPVVQTLQLEFGLFSEPQNSYVTTHNLLVVFWGPGSLDGLKGGQLRASYFPDNSDKEIIHSLIVREGRVFADGEPLPKFNQPDPDFKGNRWLRVDGRGEILLK